MSVQFVNFDLSEAVSYPKRPDMFPLEKGLLTRISRDTLAVLEVTVVSGPTMTLIQEKDWLAGIGTVPREAVCHKGLTKIVTVLEGWMAYVSKVAPNGYTVKLLERTESVRFYPNTPHVMLMGPRALVQTITWGKFVSNPQAGGEDRWSPGPNYDEIFADWKSVNYQSWRDYRHQEERLRNNHMDAD